MACIDEIVTLGICPDDGVSKSGFTLMQAAGISKKNLANIADEDSVSGANMVMEKKTIAILQVKNDFIGALQANRVVSMSAEPVYDTAIFDTNTSMGVYAGSRGTVLHKAGKYHGTLRKTYIKAIQVYPLVSGEGDIVITDGYNSYTYPVEFVAGQINTFDHTQLEGFPFEVQSDKATILINNSTITFSSTKIKCGKGCNGSVPNPCGWADGYNGTAAVKSEGYGINLQFYCECNYEQILCDLSNTFSGELIWLKWQINVFEEQYLSNRFTGWVIYNRDDIQSKVLPDLRNKYNTKWNQLMDGLYGILQTYRDGCLECRGLRRKANI